MKNIFLLLLLIPLLISCNQKSIKITVENPLDFERNGEIVEVTIAGLNVDFANKTYILKDTQGEEVAYQLLSDNQTLIFQAKAPAKASVTYTLREGTPAPVAVRAHVRFVPERRDDMSWENDIAAYRMYGPALEEIENPSNGVDIWMKYKDEPIMDSIYAGRLRNLSYHEDNGLGGFDCYDVKHTLGAGGITPYTSQLWIGDAFDRYEILESGPLRSVFTLYYDTIPVENGYYSETLTITADAGSPLNKGVVSFQKTEGFRETDKPIRLASGIFMHGDSLNTVFDEENNILSYTKNAITNKGVAKGQTYIGVYLPTAIGEPFVEDNNYTILSDYTEDKALTYYFGGAWSGWKFSSEQDWLTALAQFSQAKQTPLKILTNKRMPNMIPHLNDFPDGLKEEKNSK